MHRSPRPVQVESLTHPWNRRQVSARSRSARPAARQSSAAHQRDQPEPQEPQPQPRPHRNAGSSSSGRHRARCAEQPSQQSQRQSYLCASHSPISRPQATASEQPSKHAEQQVEDARNAKFKSEKSVSGNFATSGSFATKVPPQKKMKTYSCAKTSRPSPKFYSPTVIPAADRPYLPWFDRLTTCRSR